MLTVVLMLITGCLTTSSSETEETQFGRDHYCEQAMTHYYAAGCVYEDLPVEEAIDGCAVESLAPEWCMDDLDAWIVCSYRATADTCDCSAEMAALLACDW